MITVVYRLTHHSKDRLFFELLYFKPTSLLAPWFITTDLGVGGHSRPAPGTFKVDRSKVPAFMPSIPVAGPGSPPSATCGPTPTARIRTQVQRDEAAVTTPNHQPLTALNNPKPVSMTGRLSDMLSMAARSLQERFFSGSRLDESNCDQSLGTHHVTDNPVVAKTGSMPAASVGNSTMDVCSVGAASSVEDMWESLESTDRGVGDACLVTLPGPERSTFLSSMDASDHEAAATATAEENKENMNTSPSTMGVRVS